jgi:hypothetical protein
MLHADRDRAVWAVYGWVDHEPPAVGKDAILGRLVALSQQQAFPS